MAPTAHIMYGWVRVRTHGFPDVGGRWPRSVPVVCFVPGNAQGQGGVRAPLAVADIVEPVIAAWCDALRPFRLSDTDTFGATRRHPRRAFRAYAALLRAGWTPGALTALVAAELRALVDAAAASDDIR